MLSEQQPQGFWYRLSRRLKTRSAREARLGYAFISLWIIGFLVFQLGPLISVFYYSFTSYDVFSAPRWIGFDNYERLFTRDATVWTALGNTTYLVLVSVPLRLVIALGIAILLNQRIAAVGVFRAIFYIPMMVPVAATAVLFAWMLDSQLGVVNMFLNGLGLPSIHWLVSEGWSKPSIVIVTLWRIGEPIVLFLAGLQLIPEELYEASRIDGAGWWSRLTRITLPLLTPTTFMLIVLESIETFQSFTWSFAMTQGGPLNSSLTLVQYIYIRAFNDFRIGYASAIAVILFVVVLLLTIVLFRWSKAWVHSEQP